MFGLYVSATREMSRKNPPGAGTRLEMITTAEKVMEVDGSVPSKMHMMMLDLAHQWLAHVSYDKLVEMCKRGTLVGLPRQVKIPVDTYLACLKAKVICMPHGGTVLTDHLCPGQKVHMDFSFFHMVSARRMVAILSVIDAKTRHLCSMRQSIDRRRWTNVR